MALIIENISGALLNVNDLGFVLTIGSTIDLSIENDPLTVSFSAAPGGDLNNLITSGSIVVKDPNDDITNLSASQGIIACRSHNHPTYELMRLTGNVTQTANGVKLFLDRIIHGPASVLDFIETGGGSLTVGFQGPVSLAAPVLWTLPDADAVSSGDVLTSNAAGILSWTTIASGSTQNLWETFIADTGTTTANTITDSLTIAGGTGISTTIVGDTVTIDSTAVAADTPAVFVGMTIDIAIPTTFANIDWTVTHVENNVPTIEHDNVNTDRILIKETGLYFVGFSLSFDSDAGEETIQARVFIDDTTLVPGSLRVASEDDEINDLSHNFVAELVAGTYLTLQHLASGGGNVMHNSSSFYVTRASGSMGNDGAPGPAGTPPGGVDSNVQYNNGGVFGGNSAFNFDDAALRVNVLGNTLENQFTIGGDSQVLSAATNATLYVEVTGGGLGDEAARFYWNRGAGVGGYIAYDYDGTAPSIRILDEDDDPTFIVFQTVNTGTDAAPEFDNRFGTRGPVAGATTGFSWQVNGTEVAIMDTNFIDITSAAGEYRVNGSAIVANNLADVDTVTTVPVTGDALQFNGTNWVPVPSMRPTFCIFAEENAAITVSANNYEYSFGNGATNTDADPSGIPMGVNCTLIGIGVSGHSTGGTATASISVTNNGTVVATGGIASGTTKVQDFTAITPDTVNFVPGDTLQFLTATETATMRDIRVVAWFERTS